MRSIISAAVRIMVLCYAAVMVGCGGAETGSQVKVSDADVQKRTEGIKGAMKAGMYDNPNAKTAKAK